MKKLLHASTLIIGTSIGAGFLALPISGININFKLLVGLTLICVWVAYVTSMMAIDLNLLHKKPAAMDELCRVYAGKRAFTISLLSMYILSFALLTGYFDCFADTIHASWNFNRTAIVWISAAVLFCIFSLNKNIFSNINSSVVSILLVAIILTSIIISFSYSNIDISQKTQWKEVPSFIPIIYTSFLMQTICPRIYKDLDYDRKKITKAFWIGILVPAIIYLLWVACVLKNVTANNPDFLKQLQEHKVSVGTLIHFLCESSPFDWMDFILKLLTLLAVITSAIGFGVGLLQSLEAFIPHVLARLAVCLLPAVIVLNFPNIFIKVFSFSGMISTIFVIFMPCILLKKQTGKISISQLLCCLFGFIIIVCEWM